MAVDRQRIERDVHAALAGVTNPRTGKDVIEGEHTRDVQVDEEGNVRMQFLLHPEDPGTLVRETRAAAEKVEGVARVKIDVKLPTSSQGGGDAGPAKGGLQPGSVPAPTPQGNLIAGIDHVVAVSSGKGGVGKTTVAVNLAAALAAAGRKVGLMDADVYGPDIPLMFGETRRPAVTGEKGAEKIVPLEAHGVKLMSIGFLLEAEQPAIMRGPLISGILKQFLEQVEWGELDYLIVDMPPGTGDAQLSLVQTVDLDGAILVTTPQRVSTGDVRRAVRMFERVRTNLLGIVENMGPYTDPETGKVLDLFGSGGGRELADAMHLPFLGEVPLDPQVRIAGDEGVPTVMGAPDSAAGRAFREIAERVMAAVEAPVDAA
ncbi:MAG: Mrp/NBP35 family ATP-binding protein [Gemmatimonadota bacterium]